MLSVVDPIVKVVWILNELTNNASNYFVDFVLDKTSYDQQISMSTRNHRTAFYKLKTGTSEIVHLENFCPVWNCYQKKDLGRYD